MNVGPGRHLVSVRNAAEFLSIHPMTLRNWIDREIVPVVRFGRTIRIDLKALEKQVQAQLEAQAAAGKGGSK